MYKFIIFAIILGFYSTNAFWEHCGGTATTHNVESSVCDQDRCHATRGQPMYAITTISFRAAHPTLTLRVTTFLFGVGIVLPLPPSEADACQGLYLNGNWHGCPTVPEVQHTWVLNITVPTNIPAFQNNRVYSKFI